MSDLTFQMRLQCRYTGKENNIGQLQVEHKVNNEWQVLELNTLTPGFDIFIYAILTCQHMYFRVNAAERNLVLDTSEGTVTIGTDNHRNMESLHVDFKGNLSSGDASADAVDYIVERMGLCPVSINLKDVKHSKTTVSFNFY